MITIQIVIHGLIALVPLNDSTGKANSMMALVVDASQKPPSSECFVEHMPMLSFLPKVPGECGGPGCKVLDGLCVCVLDHEDISLQIQPDIDPSPRQRLNPAPKSNLPFDGTAAGDFSYIANLSRDQLGNHTVAPDLLEIPLPPRIPQPLVARMKFGFTSVHACFLGARPDEAGKNVHSMSFRSYGSTEGRDDLNQSVAQRAMIGLDIPDDRGVTITLTKFDQSLTRNFGAKAGPDGFAIELSNMRMEELGIDDPCDDGVGRDFAFFYNLLEQPPAWEDRAIPHIKYTQWKSERELPNPDCAVFKDPNSRPICPMASFN